jgi:hypothetical protein
MRNEVHKIVFGKKYRIVVGDKTSYRPAFWIKIDKDGSIYTSSSFKSPSFSVLMEEAGENSDEFIKLGSVISTDDKERMKASKISFHPSGSIHTNLTKNSRRYPFWEHESAQYLCYVMIPILKRLAGGDKRKSDIVISIASGGFSAEMAITCNIMIAPASSTELGMYNNKPEVHHVLVVNKFADERKQPMSVHLIFNNLADKSGLDFVTYSIQMIEKTTYVRTFPDPDNKGWTRQDSERLFLRLSDNCI